MSTTDAAAGGSGSISDVVARIERLPISWWHIKARIIIGVATFFDAFDALAIAFVLPVLVPAWKLDGPQIGFADLGRLSRPARRRAVLRLDRRALRPHHGDVLVDPDLRDHEPRLRLGLGLPVACQRAHHPRLRPRRRGSGRRRPISASSRAPRAAAASSCSTNWFSRSGWLPPASWARGSCRASAGSGCSSSARCRPSSPWCCSGCCRNRRVGWRRADATPRRRRRWPGSNAKRRIHRPTAAAAAKDHRRRSAHRVVVRSVRPDLFAANAGGVGDLVRHLFLQLRPRRLAADDLHDGVQAAAAASAAIRLDHPGRRAVRRLDLRADHRSRRPAAVVHRWRSPPMRLRSDRCSCSGRIRRSACSCW